MTKNWAERNNQRIERTLAWLTSRTNRSAPEGMLVSYSHRRLGKAQDALPVNGEALYYVCGRSKAKDTVTLLHGTMLQTIELPRRTFETGLTQVWWPEEQRTDTSGVHCDPEKYVDGLEKCAKMFCAMKPPRQFVEDTVRGAIADLRGVALERVTKFKPKKEREMAEYMKRAKKLAQDWDDNEEESEETASKPKGKATAAKKTGKKSAATKAGHDKPKTKAATGHATPKVGTVFETTFKGKAYKMKVVKNEEGEAAYQVGKELFKSPSSAGSAVTKGACNGWKFWHID